RRTKGPRRHYPRKPKLLVPLYPAKGRNDTLAKLPANDRRRCAGATVRVFIGASARRPTGLSRTQGNRAQPVQRALAHPGHGWDASARHLETARRDAEFERTGCAAAD